MTIREHSPKQDKKDVFWTKPKKIGVTVVATTGVLLASGCSTEPTKSTPESNTGSVDYSNIDIATYPNSEFVTLPYGVQVDKTARYFEKSFENGAVDNYKKDSAAINGYDMQGGVGTGSINDSPQEMVNRSTVEINTLRHESNLNLARNLVSGVFAPGTTSYNIELAKIGDGSEMTPTTYTAWESTPVFIQGAFASNSANGSPTRVYDTGEMTSGRVFDSVVQEKKSSIDPTVTEVVIIDEIGASIPGSGYVQHLNSWTPSN